MSFYVDVVESVTGNTFNHRLLFDGTAVHGANNLTHIVSSKDEWSKVLSMFKTIPSGSLSNIQWCRIPNSAVVTP